jgi:DNA polymerase-3 subunit alpha
MKYDNFGQAYTTEADLCDLLYLDPNLDLSKFQISDQPGLYNNSVHKTFAGFPNVKSYVPFGDITLEEFDQVQQSNWHMPEEYKSLDIAAWVLSQCDNEAELQRCGEELLLYQERNAFMLLRYMKYLVDTMREHGIVWGVGRGSSVSSFVLYKMGVHKINSLYYDLDHHEFLK